MSESIEISHVQWNILREKLLEDYPPSVTLIRSKMKSKLGFTNREYKDWDENARCNSVGGDHGNWRKYCVVLDFYSEKKRTFFIMKYSDYIQNQEVSETWV